VEPRHLNTHICILIDASYEKSDQVDEDSLLHNRLQRDWGLLSSAVAHPMRLLAEIINEPLEEAHYELSVHPDLDQVEIDKIWEGFSEEIKSKNRFFPDTDIRVETLESCLRSSISKIEAGTLLYRGRNNATSTDAYPRDQMGTPPSTLASSGRANPQGIAYLYVATEKNTAIAECRPSCKECVTIADFKVLEILSVVDLRGDATSPFYCILGEDPFIEDFIKGKAYREKLSEELSRIIHHSDKELSYLPTQYFCEFIKKRGWDGVMYKSALGLGDNLAIFSDKKLNCISTEIVKIQSLQYDHTLIP